MDFLRILLSAAGVVLTALVSWAAKRLIARLDAGTKKLKSSRLVCEALDAVTAAVKATYQTYVETLKKQDAFDDRAQADALEKAKAQASALLSDEAAKYLADRCGGLENWLNAAVESVLYDLKNRGD